MRRSPWMLAAAAVVAMWATSAFSQPEPAQRSASPGTAASGSGAATELVMTPGREAAALKFAQLHHPELELLLRKLKKSNPEEYKRAVRRLYQDSERLARSAERSPERHELELEAWTLDSRIRLLVARMSMSGSSELDRQLQVLLRERVELRLRQLHQERDRLASRLANLDKAITEIESDPDGAALKDLQRARRSLGIPPARPANAGRTASPSERPRTASPSASPAARPTTPGRTGSPSYTNERKNPTETTTER